MSNIFTALIGQFMDYFWCNILLKVCKRFQDVITFLLAICHSFRLSSLTILFLLPFSIVCSGKKPGWCYVWHDTETKGRTKSICSREVAAVLTEPVRKHCVILFKSVTPVNHPTTSGMSSAVERTCSPWLRPRKLRHQLWFLHLENQQ